MMWLNTPKCIGWDCPPQHRMIPPKVSVMSQWGSPRAGQEYLLSIELKFSGGYISLSPTLFHNLLKIFALIQIHSHIRVHTHGKILAPLCYDYMQYLSYRKELISGVTIFQSYHNICEMATVMIIT